MVKVKFQHGVVMSVVYVFVLCMFLISLNAFSMQKLAI